MFQLQKTIDSSSGSSNSSSTPSSGGLFSYSESYSTAIKNRQLLLLHNNTDQLQEFEIEYSADINSTTFLSSNSSTFFEKSHNSTFFTTMVSTTVQFFPLGLGLLFICILGLLGNILSVIVLSRPKMKSTYSILTLGLTLSDTIYLLTKLLRYGLLSLFEHFSLAHSYRERFYPICGPHLRALTFTAHTGSTYFTVALAVDRYISVCWPIEARYLCTKRRAYFLVLCVFFFSIFYNIPRWFEFHTEVKMDFDASLNTSITLYSMEISNLRKNMTYKTYYIFWAYFIIIFFLPFTSLTFFNFKIFKMVREANKTRKKLTPYQKREISFATMIVSIVAMFLICSSDYLVLDLLSYFHQPYPPFWDQLGNFLLTLNSSCNFVIYCVFGRKFRQEFIQITKNVLFWRQRNSSAVSSSRIIADSVSGRDGESRILEANQWKCKMKSNSVREMVLDKRETQSLEDFQ